VFGAEKVNIESQYLGTRGEVGYVITDIGLPITAGAVHLLEQLPETIRFRVL
jgi:D-3-phosphoglycerate dehydrogenase